MTHEEAVEFVAKHRRESDDVEEDDENGSQVCSMLVQEALQRWKKRSWRADNISVILMFFHKWKKKNVDAVKTATATDDVIGPPTQDVDVVPPPPPQPQPQPPSAAQRRKRKRKPASRKQKSRVVEEAEI